MDRSKTVTVKGLIHEDEYHPIGAGWWRYDTPTVMSGLVVRYEFGDPGEDHGLHRGRAQISASREGVLVQGVWPHLQDTMSVMAVSAILSCALSQFHALGNSVAYFRPQVALSPKSDQDQFDRETKEKS